MAKIDLDSLNIEELALLRDRAIEKLAEKVAARHAELEAEWRGFPSTANLRKNPRPQLPHQSQRSATRRRAMRIMTSITATG
jgi:hypothetical protein